MTWAMETPSHFIHLGVFNQSQVVFALLSVFLLVTRYCIHIESFERPPGTNLDLLLTIYASSSQSDIPATNKIYVYHLHEEPQNYHAGIAWPQWIRALGGKALYVFVMDGNLKVRTGEVDDAVTFWFADPSESSACPTSNIQTQISSDEDQSPMTLKLQATLDSVRSCSSPAAKPRMSALLTSSCLFNSTRNALNDSDSESDTESMASLSLFSETSSIESMSSLSSTASSPVSKLSNLSLPLEIPASSKVPVYVPRGRHAAPSLAPAQTIDPTSHHHLSRSQRRLAHSTVDKGKVDTCWYTYQGGQTLVMTGGVMLGGVKSAGTDNATKATKPCSSTIQMPQSVSTINSQTTRKGPDSSKNWRAHV
ncbi:hypothetical protein F5890DRAFT_1601700 [Lentinula detonsa]|uniref:Uncharacterized protein n=1 Tax=Lentinula detonsa TaxID=2804962 RepID=A0AA38PWV2_9AGAR|nr:hypothetical protein F5890DRAFT_1601700 [Lentinula detonsa]